MALLVVTAIPSAAVSAQPWTDPSGRSATAAAKSPTVHANTVSVTLVTGDKVTVTPGDGRPAAVAVRGPDGSESSARISTVGKDTYVYPTSAARFLAAGLLDKRLFNITQLMADGYDDGQVSRVPVIVTYAKGLGDTAADARRQAARLPDEATDVRPLTSVNGAALTVGASDAAEFWSALTDEPHDQGSRRSAGSASFTNGVAKVWLDGKVKATLADSTAQIGAPQVWNDGNTGKGVDVAVLDTGYDVDHPDLQDVASSKTFVPGQSVDDGSGHGTHVASTIAGTGAASDGRERGVAPGASLHVGKVLADEDYGLDSWIVAGMEWAARDVKARVISMSLGVDRPADGTDLLSRSVNELSAETGALFTIAAGNSGPSEHTVRSPGTATAALTVGAVDSADSIAQFSSRGPRLGDDALKPEITAPGVGILAARSRHARFGEGDYAALSGTSMATPHVAGAAALLAARHPDWDATLLKDALVSTAAPTDAISADDGGNGRVDAAAAVRSSLIATATADAGMHSLGGDPGETVGKQVTWTNAGSEPVTVDLAIEAPGAPEGLFTLSASRLTVPAHGTASATMTTHLDKAPAAHRYRGHVIASVSGTVTTRTLIGVSTQEKPYHLRLKLRDQQGKPVDGLVELLRKDGGPDAYSIVYSSDGEVDRILPPGTYAAWAFAHVRGVQGASSLGLGLLGQPEISLTRDTDVTLGGPTLRLTEARTPRPSVSDTEGRIDYIRSFAPAETVSVSALVDARVDSIWAQQSRKVTEGSMLYTARWRKLQPVLTLTSGDQSFDDLWLQPGSGRLPAGSRTLKTVFAGDGNPADYASIDAAGKAVVVRRGDDSEQIPAARDAGAALLLIVNDDFGRLRSPISRTPLTVVGLSASAGEKLISRIQAAGNGRVTLHAVSNPVTTYLYDLTHTWRDEIPARPVYAPKTGQLATVENDFRNNPEHKVEEYRFDLQPYTTRESGVAVPADTGRHRTDYVTADPSVRWRQYLVVAAATAVQSTDILTYSAGRTSEVTWFGPIQRPRLNGSIVELPYRTGNRMVAPDLPGWGDSGQNHVGTYGHGTQSTDLYRGAKRIAGTDGSWIEADTVAAPAGYRLVTRTEHNGSLPYSTRTLTEWSFRSAAARDASEKVQLPLIQLDYGIPTRFDGTAKRDATLTVAPSHLPGGPRASVRTTRVELSYDDGVTWRNAQLRHGADGTEVRLSAPAKATFLTVRAHATDRHGNAVTQTITRAVGIG